MKRMPDSSFPAQALILAAGRGERMRPLTDATPKPLLQVRGRPLLQWHVDALAAGGCTDLVINTAWLGEQIPAHFGATPRASDGQPLRIAYSEEGRDFGAALETAGGIVRALPSLAEVFWVVAGDVYTPGFTFRADALRRFAESDKLAHLWLVPNPAHNPWGISGWARTVWLRTSPPRFESTSALTPTAPSVCTDAHSSPRPSSSPCAPSQRATRPASKPHWRRCCARRWTMPP